MASVDPDIVTILSGQEPSDILILAPDCGEEKKKTPLITFITMMDDRMVSDRNNNTVFGLGKTVCIQMILF